MPPVGFEPTISAGERPQTYALDRAATGTGIQKGPENKIQNMRDNSVQSDQLVSMQSSKVQRN